MEKLEQLRTIIQESNKIVFFTGAGVSTESGIPDFRSVDGLYNQKYDYPPETILSHTFFLRYPEEFFRFYRDKMIYEDAKPNAAHLFMAKMEELGKSLGVVTQNIDGLHQAAGSQRVYELHGSIHRNYCVRCHKFHGLDAIKKAEGIPKCSCGGVIKPDVVLYEESLNERTIINAIDAIEAADCLIVCGTSLSVYPASGFIRYFNGKHLVLLNLSATPYDEMADLVIHEKVGEVLGALAADFE